jgi:CBS domain-containing protein
MSFFHARCERIPMTALELCQRHVVTVRRHEELTTAARMMRERNVGCLVVVEPAGATGGERVIGMLTDREIVTAVIAREADPRNMLVSDAMSHHPVTIAASSTLDEALQRMRSGGVRRIPVLDDQDRLAGILALDDIFDFMAARPPFVVTPFRRDRRTDQSGT